MLCCNHTRYDHHHIRTQMLWPNTVSTSVTYDDDHSGHPNRRISSWSHSAKGTSNPAGPYCVTFPAWCQLLCRQTDTLNAHVNTVKWRRNQLAGNYTSHTVSRMQNGDNFDLEVDHGHIHTSADGAALVVHVSGTDGVTERITLSLPPTASSQLPAVLVMHRAGFVTCFIRVSRSDSAHQITPCAARCSRRRAMGASCTC